MFSADAYTPPEYVCSVHGDIDNVVMTIIADGKETMLCVRCFKDFLLSSGVQEVTLKVC